jgi:hypothetical protein
LEIKVRDKSIADVLAMTVDPAFECFADDTALRHSLGVIREVGLGYIRLGQSATELSGGSYTFPVFTGAVSGIKLIAINPATSATSRYQDGASGSPVTCNNQVTTSCAVPPKLAIATA